MNDITVVYKTYLNDLKWLKYSLLSLKKYVINYKKLIIYCHDKSLNELYKLIDNINIDVNIIPVTYDYHGYIKQMVIKCECYKDIDTKYICILDSDLIFIDYFDMSKLIRDDGKIEWLYTEKGIINNDYDQWKIWKDAYEDMTKTPHNFYFMANSHPFVFTTDSLKKAQDGFKELHGIDYSEFCISRLNKKNISIDADIKQNFMKLCTIFEEFEWLGYYFKNNINDYIFLHSNKNIRYSHNRLKQFWSHGGITDSINKEIETIL